MTKDKMNLNRRKFITGSLAGMASLGFFNFPDRNAGISGHNKLKQNAKEDIIYRVLGKTGIRIPVVSMGVMNADNPALVMRACEVGISHFDTAASYGRGRNEEMIGKVIKELGIRDKIVIATKVPRIPLSVLKQMTTDQIKTYFLDQLAQSLKRLQTDYVDLIYLHDAQSADYLQNEGFRSGLEAAKIQKKAHFIGFSTHTKMAECLDQASRDGFYDVVLTAFNYSMYENKDLIESMERAAAKGIGLIAMKTQCSQPWYQSEYEPTENYRLYTGQIMQTALLKWVLRHEFITTAVPGFQNFQELEEDFSAVYDLTYTTEEKKFLQDRNVKLGMSSVCRQCCACMSTCPRGVEIPALIRTHMYATCYSNFYHARFTLNEIPKGKGLDMCASCSHCTAQCVNHVDIPKRIAELKVIYT